MSPENRSGYSLAVVSVGAALVVLFAGAGVIAAVGHEVPKELWSAAAALSGALVGILVPPPKSKKDTAGAAPVAAAITYTAARKAAEDEAGEINDDKDATPAVKQAATAAAADVRSSGHDVEMAAIDASASRQLGPGIVGAAIKVHEDALRKASTSVESALAAVSRAKNDSSPRRSSAPDAETAEANLKVAQARLQVHQGRRRSEPRSAHGGGRGRHERVQRRRQPAQGVAQGGPARVRVHRLARVRPRHRLGCHPPGRMHVDGRRTRSGLRSPPDPHLQSAHRAGVRGGRRADRPVRQPTIRLHAGETAGLSRARGRRLSATSAPAARARPTSTAARSGCRTWATARRTDSRSGTGTLRSAGGRRRPGARTRRSRAA